MPAEGFKAGYGCEIRPVSREANSFGPVTEAKRGPD